MNKTSASSASSSSSSSHLGQVLALGHPRGGKPAQFLLTPEGHFCELQSFQPSGSKFGSWFVEQRIVTDGRLFVASPLDPKFLLLPVLERHGAQRYSPLEQILAAETGGAYMPLRACRRLELHRICDVNDQLGDDMLLYRLNTEKTLIWLAQKVERTKKALIALEVAREGQNTGIGSGFAAGFMIQTATTPTTTTTAAAAEAKAVVPMRGLCVYVSVYAYSFFRLIFYMLALVTYSQIHTTYIYIKQKQPGKKPARPWNWSLTISPTSGHRNCKGIVASPRTK